ncbi:MAG: BlaI/MecI/CopY family transcriptional regulator [Bacteroidetes bacterium]|nr:BlaI/MecI/CopY family transcriptional regulator [Bacteroidota bacterium]
MKELTRAEEQIMQLMWEIKQGFVKDILERIEEPKPAYNTVSTIVRILEKKGFVGYIAYGKTHQYYPLISKEDYRKELMGGVVKNYFSNSFRQLASFFAEEEQLSLKELEELKLIVDQEIIKYKK